MAFSINKYHRISRGITTRHHAFEFSVETNVERVEHPFSPAMVARRDFCLLK
jgi:hypothetical protein